MKQLKPWLLFILWLVSVAFVSQAILWKPHKFSMLAWYIYILFGVTHVVFVGVVGHYAMTNPKPDKFDGIERPHSSIMADIKKARQTIAQLRQQLVWEFTLDYPCTFRDQVSVPHEGEVLVTAERCTSLVAYIQKERIENDVLRRWVSMTGEYLNKLKALNDAQPSPVLPPGMTEELNDIVHGLALARGEALKPPSPINRSNHA